MLAAGTSAFSSTHRESIHKERDRSGSGDNGRDREGGQPLCINHSKRRDTRNTLLSSVLKEMGASIESAQQKQYLTPTTNSEGTYFSPQNGRGISSVDCDSKYSEPRITSVRQIDSSENPFGDDDQGYYTQYTGLSLGQGLGQGLGLGQDHDQLEQQRARVLEMLSSRANSTCPSIRRSSLANESNSSTIDLLAQDKQYKEYDST